VGQFKKAIERHQIIPYLREGKKKEPGLLHKEEAAALNKTTKVHLDPDGKNLECIAEDKWVRQLGDNCLKSGRRCR
jgi:hypothetical protein